MDNEKWRKVTHKFAALAAEVGQKRGRLLSLRNLAGRSGRSRGSVRTKSAREKRAGQRRGAETKAEQIRQYSGMAKPRVNEIELKNKKITTEL